MVFFPRFYKKTRDFPLFHKIWLPLIFAPPNIVSLLEKFFFCRSDDRQRCL